MDDKLLLLLHFFEVVSNTQVWWSSLFLPQLNRICIKKTCNLR